MPLLVTPGSNRRVPFTFRVHVPELVKAGLNRGNLQVAWTASVGDGEPQQFQAALVVPVLAAK